MAWKGGATPPSEQPEAIVQSRGDLFRWEDLGARRGQLNRQRNPIQTSDDLRDGGSVPRRQAKGG
jgi:hypothetical protein